MENKQTHFGIKTMYLVVAMKTNNEFRFLDEHVWSCAFHTVLILMNCWPKRSDPSNLGQMTYRPANWTKRAMVAT